MISNGGAHLGITEDTETPVLHIHCGEPNEYGRYWVSCAWSGLKFKDIILIGPSVSSTAMSEEEVRLLVKTLGGQVKVEYRGAFPK